MLRRVHFSSLSQLCNKGEQKFSSIFGCDSLDNFATSNSSLAHTRIIAQSPIRTLTMASDTKTVILVTGGLFLIAYDLINNST